MYWVYYDNRAGLVVILLSSMLNSSSMVMMVLIRKGCRIEKNNDPIRDPDGVIYFIN